MKRTPWYEPHQAPARVGWYEVDILWRDRGGGMVQLSRYWTGERWSSLVLDRDRDPVSKRMGWLKPKNNVDRWRGLAEKP